MTMRPPSLLTLSFVLAGACAPLAHAPRPAPEPAPAPTCAPVPAVDPATTADQELFLTFIDELIAGRELASLTRLLAEYPASPLTVRATAVATQMKALEAKARAVGREAQQYKQDKSSCQQASEQLTFERDRLRKDLEELKRLTIEAENRNK